MTRDSMVFDCTSNLYSNGFNQNKERNKGTKQQHEKDTNRGHVTKKINHQQGVMLFIIVIVMSIFEIYMSGIIIHEYRMTKC
jgi:hypothetical protein